MRENQTIANPTNKKIVKDESEPDNHDIKKIKLEPVKQENQFEKEIITEIVKMQ